MKLIGTNFGPFVQGMAGWPENCSAPICIHCGSPFCLETAPDDYDAITDRTPGGLVFTQLEVDPACDSVGKGTWHCLPQHGNRGPDEPYAVVSTAAAARPAAPVASGSVIIHATDKKACSIARDTPDAFRDVVVDCRVKGAPTKTDDKSAHGRTRTPPPPPPPKVGYQHAFPLQTGPESPACLDGRAFTITYQLSTSGSTKWSFSIPGGGWCYDELGCLFRANSSGLGQSAGGNGQGAHYKCQADDVDDNCVVLHYCDGSSFASYRAEPWPVPESVAGVPGKTVTFRGIKNLDATFDWAFEHGLSNATSVYIGGASAGGLSTFLHADRLANKIAKQGRPDCTVVANPIDGFFCKSD
jgi:hypothetical protein